jgi:hypothetical protein
MSVEGKENTLNVDILRSEIKSWESSFQTEHGRKPARADIKRDAAIGEQQSAFHF